MVEPVKSEKSDLPDVPFVHHVTHESLRQFQHASAEAKLLWLEEANRFVNQFLSQEQRDKWERYRRGNTAS